MACSRRDKLAGYALRVVALAGLLLPRPAEPARILAVETVPGRSHWNFMRAVLRSLTDAGHHVTAFTPFPDGDRENYTEVDMSGHFPLKVEEHDLMSLLAFRDPYAVMDILAPSQKRFCDQVYANPRLGEMTRGDGGPAAAGFDAIVAEPLSLDCVSYLAAAGPWPRVPVVYAIPSPMITHAERAFTGHMSNPAAVAHLLSREAVPRTFAQRFANAALLAYSVLRTEYDRRRALGAADPRPYESCPTVSPSVVFQNSHYVTEASRPVAPNVIDVGGIHLRPPKTIPNDILDFIEDSPHGVIYFTFGSTVRLSSLPGHIEKAFKEALAKVPQKVLWKYETEMNDMPKNVMIKKWFPQREILLHPNVKLFISHGGISGVYEAVDAGVPVLGFPLIYDQPRNIEHLVRAEMAISMDLLTVSEEKLSNSISELTNNEKYMINAKIASLRFKDRPMTAAQSVVYWTEYVIRHKGAPHLKSHALNLTWYQYFLLDVIGLALICISLVVFVMYTIFKNIYHFVSKFSKKIKIKSQ